MDRRRINRNQVLAAIHEEVWPLLEIDGFYNFSNVSALRYSEPFIRVIEIEFLTPYDARAYRCTEESFRVHLGLYVMGEGREDAMQRDRDGLLLPSIHSCTFRAVLKKQTEVDGFAAHDIFSIDPEGVTIPACIEEIRGQVAEDVRRWFEAMSDIGRLIEFLSAPKVPVVAGTYLQPNLPSSRDEDALANLQTILFQREPTARSAAATLETIDKIIGTSTRFVCGVLPPDSDEEKTERIYELWRRLGSYSPIPQRPDSPAATSRKPQKRATAKEIWPALRERGFTEFSDRWAHRVHEDFVEVVDVSPIGSWDQKTLDGKPGLFYAGVGIFWNELAERSYRKDAAGNPRPTVRQCHLMMWLRPPVPRSEATSLAFDDPREALQAILTHGVNWLAEFADAETSVAHLQRHHRDLFLSYPLMRGYGDKGSTERSLLLAIQSKRLGRVGEVREYMRAAMAASQSDDPRSSERMRLDRVVSRLGLSD